MRIIGRVCCSALLLTVTGSAQDIPGKKTPSVTMTAVPLQTVTRGKSNKIDLEFHVGSGFHINSNKPTLNYLIPTALKLDAPTDIVLGVTYPPGEEATFPFAPDDKLSVYSGTFNLSVGVRPLKGMLPGKYVLRGNLKYQACDNASCYPPKQLPVEFDVKVVKGPPPPHHNPAQSPHVH
ncbi:MAG TPA: disulfide bond formation protein DsbC [Terriglobales bacterium]|nr:disulfide bond formation protein DsbC [Terriglobales bacterium]